MQVQYVVSVRGGALSLVLIVQATAKRNRAFFKPRDKPRLRWSDALLQGPTVGLTSGSGFFEPDTALRAPAPPAAVARRREEGTLGRSLRAGSTHGAVRGR